MAKRNMKQIIEETKVPDEYALTIYEMRELYEGGGVGVVWDGFRYGFAQGMFFQNEEYEKKSPTSMDDITYCVITGALVQAVDELKALLYDKDSDGRAGIAKNEIENALEMLFQWYHYGEVVKLED